MGCKPRHVVSRHLVAAVLVLILTFFQTIGGGSTAFAQQPRTLRIAGLEGNNRVIKKDNDLRLVVEVRDDQKVPVVGAEVTFVAPEAGPGVLFANNANRLTIKTDTFGRAQTGVTRSVGNGPFVISIVASYQGQTTSSSAQATNQTSPASNPDAKKKSGKWKWILIGVGAAAAVGIVVATSGSGSDSNPQTPPTTIVVGPPTVGAP